MINWQENLKNLAYGLRKTLGENTEIVVHDFSNLDKSVIHVSGNITGRFVGAPITHILLEYLREEKKEDILNIKVNLKDGRIIKSSSIFVYDKNINPIGCISINIDVTHLYHIKNSINTFLNDSKQTESDAIFSNEINQVFEKIIEETIVKYNKPVAYMSKEDKLIVIKELDHKGAFLIKGGIERIANELNVSRF